MQMAVLIEGFLLKEARVLKTKQNDLFTNSALHNHRSVIKSNLKSKGQYIYEKFIKLYINEYVEGSILEIINN